MLFRSIEDIDWVQKVIESKLTSQFIEKVTDAVGKLTDKSDPKDIAKVILQLFSSADK